ncbi:MAG: cation diffusion facilitator family transporter [bacterium]
MSSLVQRASRGRSILLAGVIINMLLAAVKMSAGWFGHSDALIADGLESTLDVLSSALIWLALKYAERPPDSEHPYGHGKMESLAGVAGALLLLGAGAMVAVNSLREILYGAGNRPLPAPFTLGVLVFVVIVKETLFRAAIARNREVESLALESDAWHHRSDALTSLAAAIGILLALIGGSRWVSADDWAALFSCVIIALNGVRMFRASLGELLDAQAPAETIQKIIDCAQAVPGVENVEKCRVRKSGLTFLADLHVRVCGDATVSAGHHISHLVKDALMDGGYHLSDVTVHIEPAEEAAKA